MTEPPPPSSSRRILSAADPVSETTKHLAYAEAAFMLMECLMLFLIERGLLTSDEMRTQIETVITTKQQMIEDGEHPEISTIAAGMLASVANSVAAARRAGCT